jgi:signal peptidase I
MAMTQHGKKKDEGVWDTIKVVIQALLIAFVIRTFLSSRSTFLRGPCIPH